MLSYQILEEQPIGTILTALQATDTDSNIDEYRLEPNNYFEINNMTGELSISSLECSHYSWNHLVIESIRAEYIT